MTREEFDERVRQLEQRTKENPNALKFRILSLAALGYSVFALWFLGFAGLGGLLAYLGTLGTRTGEASWLIGVGAAVFLAGIGTVGRRLWVRLERPEGFEIKRWNAPALFTRLEDLRRRLQAGRFHRVLLTGGCNASVVQLPRLGVFGWNKNYLVLGLPLLDSMSPEEVSAVLAHEYAHLSKKHGRFGAWIYRLRRSWENVFAELMKPQARGSISIRPLVRRFLDWFWPRFHAHAFVLSRSNEYEADASAARFAGPEHLASALLRTGYYVRLIDEKLWPEIWKDANTLAAPPDSVFERLREGLRRPIPQEESAKWVEQEFRMVTTNADTHPSLSDRLRALGFLPADLERGTFPPAPSLPRVSATQALLGEFEAAARSAINDLWKKNCADRWREAHARAQSLQHRLHRIDSHPEAETDVDRLWDQAQVTMQLDTPEKVEPFLRRILAINPTHVPACFCLGRHLLAEGNEAGVTLLEEALDREENLVPEGCEVLLDFHRRHGREREIRNLLQRLDAHEAAMHASHAERSSISPRDVFIPHELGHAELNELLAVLQREPDIRQAHLARKQMPHFPRQKLFVLALGVPRAWIGGAARDAALVRRVHSCLRLAGRVLVIVESGSWRAVARRVRRVEGSMIYPEVAKT